MTRVELRGVTVKYGSLKALKKVSMTVEDGSYVVVAGPTGAGKTTLLKAICGLVPVQGKILFNGREVTGVPPERRGIGYLPQGYALFPHLTVWKNTAFGMVCRRWSRDDIERVARRILNMVGLLERADAYPRELSGGMAQRTALARAVASGADLILLDEPLSALDFMLRLKLRYEIRKLSKALGLTVIHVTHDHEEAMSIADKIFILGNGCLIESGSPKRLYEKPLNPFTAYFIGECNLYRGHSKAGIVEIGNVRLNSHFKVDGDVLVAVKTKKIKVLKRGAGLSGVVEEVRFLGRSTKGRVRVGDVRYLCEQPTVYLQNLEAGMKVKVRISPEDVLLYPWSTVEEYPEVKMRVLNA